MERHGGNATKVGKKLSVKSRTENVDFDDFEGVRQM